MAGGSFTDPRTIGDFLKLQHFNLPKLPVPKSAFTSADDVVKPGLSDDVLQRLALLRPPVEQGDAEIRWGKPSKFVINEPDQPDQITYTTIVNTTTNDPKPPDGAKIVWFDGFKAAAETIRVENPDDPEQFVMVERYLWAIFQGRDDGIFRGFNFQPFYQD